MQTRYRTFGWDSSRTDWKSSPELTSSHETGKGKEKKGKGCEGQGTIEKGRCLGSFLTVLKSLWHVADGHLAMCKNENGVKLVLVWWSQCCYCSVLISVHSKPSVLCASFTTLYIVHTASISEVGVDVHIIITVIFVGCCVMVTSRVIVHSKWSLSTALWSCQTFEPLRLLRELGEVLVQCAACY